MVSANVWRSSWPPIVVTSIAVAAILVFNDTSVTDLLLFVAYCGLIVAPPGIFVWRSLLQQIRATGRGAPTWLEDLSMGTIVGFGLQLPVYLVGLVIGFPYLVLVLPVATLGALFTPFGRRIWSLQTERFDYRGSWVISGTIIYAVYWLANRVFVSSPMNLPASRTPRLDETFHLALMGELSHQFPPQFPYVEGITLDYHWFVHAQLATMRWITGIDGTLLIRQLLPVMLVVLIVTGLASVAKRLTRRTSAAVVAPVLLFAAGGFQLYSTDFAVRVITEPVMSARFVSSPSQSYGVMMSLPALLLIMEILRPKKRNHPLTWVALALSLLALSGSKATFIPIFLCGAIGVVLFRLLVERRIDRTALALGAMLIATALFAQFVLFGGNSGAMAFDPGRSVTEALRRQSVEATPLSHVLMALAMLMGWLLYGAGAIGLVKRAKWRDPRALWMLAAITAALAVPFLLFRTGAIQYWFQRSAAELIVLLSVWGLALLLPKPLTRQVALRLSGVAVVSGFVAYLITLFVGSSYGKDGTASLAGLVLVVFVPAVLTLGFLIIRFVQRRRGKAPWPVLMLVTVLLGLGLNNVYILVGNMLQGQKPAGNSQIFPPGGESAAAYIRANSDPDDVVATNMHCLSPGNVPGDRACDNRHFWASAFSERRFVIEGWGYNPEAYENATEGEGLGDIKPPNPELIALNDAAFIDPSEETIGRLVEDHSVDWLFVGKDWPVDLAGLDALPDLVARRYENGNYVVYEVIDP